MRILLAALCLGMIVFVNAQYVNVLNTFAVNQLSDSTSWFVVQNFPTVVFWIKMTLLACSIVLVAYEIIKRKRG